MNPKFASLAAVVAAAAFVSACSSTAPTTTVRPSTPTLSQAGNLIGPDGRTLYTYTDDVAGSKQSACYGACATNWPPLTASATAVSLGDYTIIQRNDDVRQWAYKGMPLYYFAKDVKAGDKLGDGLAGKWRVAQP